MILKSIFETGVSIGSRVAEVFMSKGDIKYLVLYSILKKPMHGYEIISSISEEFVGLYKPSPGTIYPTLQLLEEQDMITSTTIGLRNRKMSFRVELSLNGTITVSSLVLQNRKWISTDR